MHSAIASFESLLRGSFNLWWTVAALREYLGGNPLQGLQLFENTRGKEAVKPLGLLKISGWQSSCLQSGEKAMPVYTPVDRAAQKLNVPVEKLWILQAFGWISITEKSGTHFVRADHEYKAKFILHLQDVLRLTPEQISTVLLAQEPHYSLKDVPRVLAGTPPVKQASH